MADKNKKSLILGLILIVIAFVCTVGVLYFMGQKQGVNREKISSLEVELANLIGRKSEAIIQQTDPDWSKRESIALGDYLAKAETIYGKAELDRKEGVLWIDRKASSFIVTLGLVNGLRAGTTLGIYEGDTRIGRVVIQKTFDIISFVKPLQKSINDFEQDYYKAIVEE